MSRVKRGTLRSHVALSLGASAASVAVSLATLPYVVNGLGLSQYGLFTLLALASAYVGILDFGFSWTTSRYVADALEREDPTLLHDVVATALVLYAVLAVVGSAALALAAPILVEDVFSVDEQLRADGIAAARLFALAFPAAMAQIYAAALLRGAQRFDLTTGLQGSSAVATAGGIALAVARGGGIVGVSAVVAAVQVVFGVLMLAAARWIFPIALTLRPPKVAVVRTLARFTGKVAVSNLGLQLLYVPNRLAVGVLLPLSAVTRFAVPLSLAQRLQVVPTALVSAALPTLTAAAARSDDETFRHTFWRLILANAVLLAPISFLAVIWAPTILGVWVSSELTGDAATVLRLAVGAVLLNAAASVYSVACDSSGAPGVPALAAVSAGLANLVLAFVLTSVAGVVGAALALTLALALLLLVVAVLWRRSGLPRLLPMMQREAPRPATTAAGAAVGGTWVGLALLAEGWVVDRASLALWTFVCLGTGYGALLSFFGRPLLGSWMPRVGKDVRV